ncbi:hypothetical protein QJS10_CPB14g00237 [Acorus calamus]|uniref:Rad60/SUMO-like domain-containing protein n=1 Tax=Acorus calamus TaxID=4465 RepID=A0AAV9DAF2_ACOCL|nr:hypothetical protein QJS10_CPB14g00237 [Acorus calamus]
MDESTEDLEPLFDYSRVQPVGLIDLEDEGDEQVLPEVVKGKRKSDLTPKVTPQGEKVVKEQKKVTHVIDDDDDEWLRPPPPTKVFNRTQDLNGDKTLLELRSKKQELASLLQSAEDVIRAAEEAAKKELNSSKDAVLESETDKAAKPRVERKKVVISIQDKDGLKQFRVYKDDKLEKLFKMYAKKVKVNLAKLVFCFDGDRISPSATPAGLGLEDEDMIEVHIK